MKDKRLLHWKHSEKISILHSRNIRFEARNEQLCYALRDEVATILSTRSAYIVFNLEVYIQSLMLMHLHLHL